MMLMGLLVGICPLAAESLPRGVVDEITGLTTFKNCRLITTEWSDGDSFGVRFPDGSAHTIRLYGVDCFETSNRHPTDQRRLRSQRAYFGIAGAGGDEKSSIKLAIMLGTVAKGRVGELLSQPFQVHTAWADGRGHPQHKRYYGFITGAAGRDLGQLLVREGLARAFGVARARRAGVNREEYRDRLRDEELAAASRRVGAWKFTDWETLPEERRVERVREEEERVRALPLERASVNPNTASKLELMRLPGVGEVLAMRIIEARERWAYQTPADLLRVAGIGKHTAEKISPYLSFEENKP